MVLLLCLFLLLGSAFGFAICFLSLVFRFSFPFRVCLRLNFLSLKFT